MKHAYPPEASGETTVKVPTRRTLAKQNTRAKVLAAARRLFSESGYEGATIRDIASEAGMSTGAVFANFADKSDLFREIMMADLATLNEQTREAAGRGKDVDEALLKIFSTAYAFYKSQLPLARAAFSVSWSPQDGPMLRGAPPITTLRDQMGDQLTQAVQRGELGQESEVKLRAEMLFDAYLSNYPLAIFEGWSLDALRARSQDQIRVILSGARPGQLPAR